MKYVSTIVAFIAIILCVVLFIKLDKLTPAEETRTETPAAEVDPVVVMGRLQIYMNKLYFAGKEENKALYQFYLNELREGMTEVAGGKITMDNIDISGNMEAFGLPSLKVIEKRIGEEGFKNFDTHYNNVVTACNSCHKVAQKGFIAITVPKTPIFDNQIYKKGEFSDMLVDTDGD
ncbi:MAG: hypothetical protein V4616_03780 [Bacteroidota bacterium]